MDITQLGRFEVIGELGAGGMGIVYKGRDPKINRLVALKTILPTFGQREMSDTQKEAAKRFYIEAQAAGQLSHPNIVTIYDVGEQPSDNGPIVFIAMEFLEGKELEWCVKNGTFETLEAKVDIVRQIADGLNYAHEHDVIHRDIKPANIIVTAGDVPKITDFGLARLADSSLTMSGTILGTPNYMAPEQVRGARVDGRTDLFSLTVLLYEMLTNEKPFTGDSITSVIYKVVNENPIPPAQIDPSLPPPLDAFISKGLAKNPDQRFQTGAEFIKALDAVVSGKGGLVEIFGDTTMAIDPNDSQAIRKAALKESAIAESGGGNKGLIFGGIGALVVGLIIAVVMLLGGGEKKPAPAPAPTPAPTVAVAPPAPTVEVVVFGPPPPPDTATETANPAKDALLSPDQIKPNDPKAKEEAKNQAKEIKEAAEPPKEKVKPVKKAKKVKKAAPVIGLLSITSNPPGAIISVNGKPVGSSPLQGLKFRSGKYTISATLEGYSPDEKEVTLKDKVSVALTLIKKEPEIVFSPLPEGATALQVLTPEGATVTVDGRNYKERSLTVTELSSGTHMLYVQRKGKKPFVERFVIKEGQVKQYDLMNE